MSRGRSFLLLSAPCLSSQEVMLAAGLNQSAEIMGRGRHRSTDQHAQIVISCHHAWRSALHRLPLTAESRSHRYVTPRWRRHGGTDLPPHCSPSSGGELSCISSTSHHHLMRLSSRRTVWELFMNQQKFSSLSVKDGFISRLRCDPSAASLPSLFNMLLISLCSLCCI